MKLDLLLLITSLVSQTAASSYGGIPQAQVDSKFNKPDPLKNKEPMHVMVSLMFGTRSHIKNLFEVGKVLQSRGHKISYMTVKSLMRYADGYNVTKYQVGPEDIDVDDNRGISENNLKPFNPLTDTIHALQDIMPNVYRTTFSDILHTVKEVKPDLMVCDFFSVTCIDAAYKLGIPLMIGFQTLDGPFFPTPYITGPLSYFPITVDQLSFVNRFYSTVIHPLILLPSYYKLNKLVNAERVKFGIKPTAALDVANWGPAMKLCNTFFGFEQARPFDPTVKMVGPIMSDEFAPLTPELSKFLDGKSKTMYVAFGSGVELSIKDIEIMLKSAADLVNQGKADGVVWAIGRTKLSTFNNSKISIKLQDGTELNSNDLLNNKHPKIRFVKWAPQIAILNHKAVRLFVSHGGLESVFESVYSATPILVIPFFGDQFRNARKCEELGFGGYSDHYTHTSKSLLDKMHHMLDDSDGYIANNALKWQVVTRMNSKRKYEAANLIEEYVMTHRICAKAPKHKDDLLKHDPKNLKFCEINHLQPAKKRMSWLVGNGIDVFMTAAVIVLILLTPIVMALKSLVGLTTNIKTHKVKKA